MDMVGLDGGGTRTRAVRVGGDGRIKGWASGGCGNFQRIGLDGLENLLQGIWSQLGLRTVHKVSLCLALAGAGRPAEQAAIVRRIRLAGVANLVAAVSDAEAAFEGAHGGRPGIVAIAGTGSIVLGRDAAAHWVRAGGWGPVLGDEGSGYAIGLAGIRAALRARDGWGRQTLLQDSLSAALGLGHWDQIVARVYGDGLGRDGLAALAKQVFAAARAQDPVAADIVAAAGRDLGRQVGAVAVRLGMVRAAHVAGCGGVFDAGAGMQEAVRAGAEESVGQVVWRRPSAPPVLGAALIACRQAGVKISARRLEAWGSTLPAALSAGGARRFT